jgi:hypothetical protein
MMSGSYVEDRWEVNEKNDETMKDTLVAAYSISVGWLYLEGTSGDYYDDRAFRAGALTRERRTPSVTGNKAV